MSDSNQLEASLKTLLWHSDAVVTASKYGIVRQMESLVVSLLSDFVQKSSAKIEFISGRNWINCRLDEDMMLKILPISNVKNNSAVREIKYSRIRSKHRFALSLYILADAHKNMLHGKKSTVRELYYTNITLTVSQVYVNSALLDLTYKLQKPSWELGIMSSGKGLVAGALSFVMTNGDLIDCGSTNGATLIPSNLEGIDLLKTTANFVLLVEKDTVFHKFIGDTLYRSIANKVLLVTGKGFPDMATRVLLNRLYFECFLPIYALFDANPFGIEILHVYKHGSCALAHVAQQLACPKIQWIGIHPSEVALMNLRTEALSQRDNKKISELLSRDYVETSCRHELHIMQRLQRKAEIENVTVITLNFLLEDYIPNKIKRKLVL